MGKCCHEGKSIIHESKKCSGLSDFTNRQPVEQINSVTQTEGSVDVIERLTSPDLVACMPTKRNPSMSLADAKFPVDIGNRGIPVHRIAKSTVRCVGTPKNISCHQAQGLDQAMCKYLLPRTSIAGGCRDLEVM